MRQYELMYILPAKLEEEEKKAIMERVSSLLTEHKAIIHDHDVWLTRKLSYPIKHIRQGIFILAHFSMETENVKSLNLELQRDGEILRHTIVLDEGTLNVKKTSNESKTPKKQNEIVDTDNKTSDNETKPEATENTNLDLKDLDKKIEEILEDNSINV